MGRWGGFGDKTTFGLRWSNSLIVSKNYERLLGVRIVLSSDISMATIISLGSTQIVLLALMSINSNLDLIPNFPIHLGAGQLTFL